MHISSTLYILFISVIHLVFISSGCAQASEEINGDTLMSAQQESVVLRKTEFTLNDFLNQDDDLDFWTDEIIKNLSLEEKIAQLIMPAMGRHGQTKKEIDALVNDGLIGGILMLNGSKEEFRNWVNEYNILNSKLGRLGFLYSADAEPSLINRKITNTKTVAKANTLKTPEEVRQVTNIISDELNEIGINYNFAPVVDMSPNKTVGWRSFGHVPDSVIPWSNQFIKTTQERNIIATAKHFPGHGYVVGDTHEKLVFIDGEMKEVKNYPPLIENGVLSIMIAHIAVNNNEKYNTKTFPSTTSRAIVTELLRDSLKFEGLIVTDALNMGGVRNVENANLLAVNAGCDILLMPLNAREAHTQLLNAYQQNELTKNEIEASARRIIRMKICLGLIPLSDTENLKTN